MMFDLTLQQRVEMFNKRWRFHKIATFTVGGILFIIYPFLMDFAIILNTGPGTIHGTSSYQYAHFWAYAASLVMWMVTIVVGIVYLDRMRKTLWADPQHSAAKAFMLILKLGFISALVGSLLVNVMAVLIVLGFGVYILVINYFVKKF